MECNVANIIYVNQNNTNGVQNGLSWLTAFSDLQPALDKANLSVGKSVIFVAAGTYIPSLTYSPNGIPGGAANVTDPTILFNLRTFNIPNNTAIYGGFNGTEKTVCQRNIKKNKTILTGAAVFYHVVIFGNDVAQTGVNAQLNGLTITQGNAQGPIFSPTGTIFAPFQYAHNYGAGLYITFESNVLIKKCTLVNNYATGIGGAVFSISSNTILLDCNIKTNRSNGQAGAVAIYNTYETEAHTGLIEKCNFRNNSTVDFGGAIVVEGTFADADTKCEIIASNFYENYAEEGGAIVVDSEAVIIDSCLFKKNNSAINAGALATTNVVNTIASNTLGRPLVKFPTTVNKCVFVENVTQGNVALHDTFLGGPAGSFALDFARGGGAAVCYINGMLNFNNCRFIDNIAYNSYGGAILNGYSALGLYPAFQVATTVLQCEFSNNKSINGNGGAIASLPSQYPFVPPLGITKADTFLSVIRSNFVENYATLEGGAIYLNNSTAILKNNHYKNNHPDNVFEM